MLYSRSYTAPIVIAREDSLPGGPKPGSYSGRQYLKAWRKWKAEERPLGAWYAFVCAYRQAGTTFDQRALKSCLKNKALTQIGPAEQALLVILSDVKALRFQTAAEGLKRFEERFGASDRLSPDDRTEYEYISVLVRHAQFMRENGGYFHHVGLPADESVELMRDLMRIGHDKEAREVFCVQLHSEREEEAEFSPQMRVFVLEHPDYLGEAGFALRLIAKGSIIQGVSRLLAMDREGKSDEDRLESVLQTVLLYAAAKNPVWGSAESWEKAEAEALALMPEEASIPPRRPFRLEGKREERANKGPDVSLEEFNRRYLLEARRFLRLHHWLRLGDLEAFEREIGTGKLTPIEAALAWIVQLRSGLLKGASQEALGQVRPAKTKCFVSGWRWRFVRQKIREELIQTEVIPSAHVNKQAPFEGEHVEPSLDFASVKLVQSLMPSRSRTSEAAREKALDLVNRIQAAGKSADDAVFNALLGELGAIAQRDRGVEWWRAAMEINQFDAAQRMFSQNEQIGILVRTYQMNRYMPEGNKALARLLQLKLEALLQYEVLTGRGLVRELRLPLALGLPWYKTVERELGRILFWQVLENGMNVLVIESKADPKRLFLLTTNFDECIRFRLRLGQPEPEHYELVMQMEKKDLEEDYETFLCQACEIFALNLVSENFIAEEYGSVSLKTGEPLVKGYPYYETLISCREQILRSPLWDEKGRSLKLASLLFLKKLESEAAYQFGVDPVLETRPRDFFLLLKRRRGNAFPAAKPLVKAEAVPQALAELPYANEQCFVDRAVMEEGKPVESVFPMSRKEEERVLLYFSAKPRAEIEGAVNINPKDCLSVCVKQVLVLEPALQYVLKDAHEAEFVRDGEGFRKVESEAYMLPAFFSTEGPVGLA